MGHLFLVFTFANSIPFSSCMYLSKRLRCFPPSLYLGSHIFLSPIYLVFVWAPPYSETLVMKWLHTLSHTLCGRVPYIHF